MIVGWSLLWLSLCYGKHLGEGSRFPRHWKPGRRSRSLTETAPAFRWGPATASWGGLPYRTLRTPRFSNEQRTNRTSYGDYTPGNCDKSLPGREEILGGLSSFQSLPARLAHTPHKRSELPRSREVTRAHIGPACFDLAGPGTEPPN